MQIRYPFHVDDKGLTAGAESDAHVRDLIEQVLFTAPGERVMRPDFGSGLLGLVFEPNSSTLAATTQVLVQGALQQHLGHLIALRAVNVEPVDAHLEVTVQYVVLRDRSAQEARFDFSAGSGA